MAAVHICPVCGDVSDRRNTRLKGDVREVPCSECVEFAKGLKKEELERQAEFEAYALLLMDDDGWECDSPEPWDNE